MGEPHVSSHPDLFLSIAGGNDISKEFDKFEWKSFTNGGYIIRARLHDPYWNILKSFATQSYLKKGRKEPTPVIFEQMWPGSRSPNNRTGRHLAYMTDLDAKGTNAGGILEFIAVDPPSYWLNAGDSAGKVYQGNVKKVIEQVLQEYWVKPNDNIGTFKVSDTKDWDQNLWYMMRMDPKTFIQSLLDWSASVTQKQTNWIVSSDGAISSSPSIYIMEQAEKPTIDYGLYVVDLKSPSANDSYNFEFLADNFISVFQKQLITHGISAVSERYLDRKTDTTRQIVHVYDERTAAKKNVTIDEKHGFTKPQGSTSATEPPHEWSTAIMAIPEHNAGDVGPTYGNYIDGRARGTFLNMLNLVMRIKIRVNGESMKELASSHNLGVSKLKIAWIDADGAPYFLDGDWLVYGFHHVMIRDDWITDLYCARLDHDAEAQRLPNSPNKYQDKYKST